MKVPQAPFVGAPVYGLPPMSWEILDTKWEKVVLNGFFIVKITPVKIDIKWDDDKASGVLTPRAVTTKPHDEILGKISSDLGVSGSSFYFATQARSLMETMENNFGESFYQQAADAGSTMGTYFSQFRQLHGGTGTKEQFSKFVGQIADSAGSSLLKNIASGLVTAADKAISGIGKAGVGDIANVLTGGRVDLPRVWTGSSWSFDSTLNFKFIAPSANQQDVIDHVVTPIHILKYLAAAISRDGGLIYNEPPFLEVEIPFLYYNPTCGFRSLNIEHGGDNGTFSFDQLPLITNASVQFESLRLVQPTLIDKDPRGSYDISTKKSFAYSSGKGTAGGNGTLRPGRKAENLNDVFQDPSTSSSAGKRSAPEGADTEPQNIANFAAPNISKPSANQTIAAQRDVADKLKGF